MLVIKVPIVRVSCGITPNITNEITPTTNTTVRSRLIGLDSFLTILFSFFAFLKIVLSKKLIGTLVRNAIASNFSYFNSKAYADSEYPVGICIRFVLENYFTLYFVNLLFDSVCCNTTFFEKPLVSCLFCSRNFHGYLFGNSFKCRFSNGFQGFYLLHVDGF